MSEKNSPIFRFKCGNISIAAFEGQYGRYYSLQRSVLNPKTKEWKRENIFVSPQDFLNLGFVAQTALTWHLTNPEEKRERQQEIPQQTSQNESEGVPF